MGKVIKFKRGRQMARARTGMYSPPGEEWRLDRSISILVIISLISFAITGIAYAVSFKQDVDRLKDIPDRVIRIEEQVAAIKGTTGRIESYIIESHNAKIQ